LIETGDPSDRRAFFSFGPVDVVKNEENYEDDKADRDPARPALLSDR
jgi:hypothetical protein